MRILNTAEQAQAIAEALKSLYVKLFGYESGDPKYNAQRNLAGRTHYVDDETLRYHKSRVTSSGQIGASWGLLFRVTTSDALDMHNTRRGFRCAVFDVFGTIVYREELEHAFSSSAAAQKACNAEEFDLVAHYQKVIAERLAQAEQEAQKLRTLSESLNAMVEPVAA